MSDEQLICLKCGDRNTTKRAFLKIPGWSNEHSVYLKNCIGQEIEGCGHGDLAVVGQYGCGLVLLRKEILCDSWNVGGSRAMSPSPSALILCSRPQAGFAV